MKKGAKIAIPINMKVDYEVMILQTLQQILLEIRELTSSIKGK